MKVAEAYIEIQARFDRFRSDLKRTVANVSQSSRKMQSDVDRSASRIGRRMSSLSTSLQRNARVIATAWTAAFGAISIAAARSAAQLDRFAKVARRLDASAASVRGLSILGERGGISSQQMATILQRLTRRVGDARRGMAVRSAFDAIGVNPDQLGGMTLEDQFFRVLRGVQNVRDPNLRTSLIGQILDVEGVQAQQLLGSSPGQLRGQFERARMLGGNFTQQQYADVESLNDAIADLKQGFMTGIDRLVIKVASIESLVRAIRQAGEQAAGGNASDGYNAARVVGNAALARVVSGFRARFNTTLVSGTRFGRMVDRGLLGLQGAASSSVARGIGGIAGTTDGEAYARQSSTFNPANPNWQVPFMRMREFERRMTRPTSGPMDNPYQPTPFGANARRRFLPTSGPMDRPLPQGAGPMSPSMLGFGLPSAGLGILTSAITRAFGSIGGIPAVRPGVTEQDVGTAIGQFRTATRDQVSQGILRNSREQLEVLRNILIEIRDGGNRSFV